MKYPRTARQDLDAMIDHHKSCGREYDELDLEDQQTMCALKALTWADHEQMDVMDGMTGRDFLCYMALMNSDSMRAKELASEYAFTKIQDFMTPFVLEEYAANSTQADVYEEDDNRTLHNRVEAAEYNREMRVGR